MIWRPGCVTRCVRCPIFRNRVSCFATSPRCWRPATCSRGWWPGWPSSARAHDADRVACIESRGFLFGAPLAERLGLPLALIRKPGKLPHRTVRQDYALEYGTDALEIHADACGSGDRVVLIDDVLATGGTAAAACELIERLGAGVAGVLFVVELSELDGRTRLRHRPLQSLARV